jgi:hypothetical protein
VLTGAVRRFAIACALFAACDGGEATLAVELKTDWVPGLQLYGIRTEVGPVGLATVEASSDMFAMPRGDYLAGQRVAEFSDVSPGPKAVRVTLLDADGDPIAVQTVIIEVSSVHVVTVLISSSCEAVTCPGEGDDPAHTACLGGRCVDPRCSPQTPEFCPAGCASDADCSVEIDCAVPLCSDGVCFARPDDAECAPLVCDPSRGCVPAPGSDAGPACPATETVCVDGIDDDCDAMIDCADPDCANEACDDGSACTENDACGDGVCAGETIECDDSNPCTDDACDDTIGCTTANNTAACDDASTCTIDDVCADGVCAGTTIGCDDMNPCTDDTCDAALGCQHTNNTADCDDGFWCNGPDRCLDGACDDHGPAPCASFCNEMTRVCDQCAVDADCGAVSNGPWSMCDYTTICDTAATQTRSVMTPRCMAGMCSVVTTTETMPCTRPTNGMMCGSTTFTSWTACGYTDACDQAATRTRTRTDRECAAGVCTAMNTTERTNCSRTVPNGTSCGGTWSRCCSGVCRDLRTNTYCGACRVNCNTIGDTCASTGTGGYACRGCTSNMQCTSILSGSATCYNISAPPAFCQCQCPSTGVCADAGCGSGFYCHSCPGTNFCAPFGGSC